MHGTDLIELATAIERRAARAVKRAHELIADGPLIGDQLLPAWAELSRKLIGDELRSEWLRMHSDRKPKRGELQLLTKMFTQLDTALQEALAHVEPEHMPHAAGATVSALVTPARRRS